MKILKKRTDELECGDILIINWLEIFDKDMPCIHVQGRPRLIINKFEGESCVILYEIDSVDMDVDDDGNNVWILTHSDSLFGEWRALTIHGCDEWEWDVIDNPHKLKCSGNRDDILYHSYFGSSIFEDHPDFDPKFVKGLVKKNLWE